MKPQNQRKNIVTNTFEQVGEVGKKAATESVKTVIDTFTFAEFLGLKSNEKTPHEQKVQKEINDKTEDEQKKLGEKFTSSDAQRITDDVQKLEEARKHLFDLVKSDEAKARESLRNEAEEKEQDERALEQQKHQELQRQQQISQQDSLPQGKQKGVMGQARKKATTAPAQNFEVKSNKGK